MYCWRELPAGEGHLPRDRDGSLELLVQPSMVMILRWAPHMAQPGDLLLCPCWVGEGIVIVLLWLSPPFCPQRKLHEGFRQRDDGLSWSPGDTPRPSLGPRGRENSVRTEMCLCAGGRGYFEHHGNGVGGRAVSVALEMAAGHGISALS